MYPDDKWIKPEINKQKNFWDKSLIVKKLNTLVISSEIKEITRIEWNKNTTHQNVRCSWNSASGRLLTFYTYF